VLYTPTSGSEELSRVSSRFMSRRMWTVLQTVSPLSQSLLQRTHTCVSTLTVHQSLANDLVYVGKPLGQVAKLLGHDSLDATRIHTRPSERVPERVIRRAAGEISRDYG